MNLGRRILGPRVRRDLLRHAERLAEDVPIERLRSRVEQLPAPRNRIHRPARMAAAEQLLMTWFAEAGAATERQPFSLSQVSGYRDHGDFDRILYDRLDGVNVVATLPGRTPEAIVVVAHYDTVRDSPGANDNSASVVALVEVTRALSALPLPATVVLAATDLEEPGFFGASALVGLLASRGRPRLAINFESMAYTCVQPDTQRVPAGLAILYPTQVARMRYRGLRADFTVLIYNRSASRPAALLRHVLGHLCAPAAPAALSDPNGLPVVGGWLRRNVRAARHFRRSDHVAFWDSGIPAIQITDTADMRYPHYHRPTDTPDRLDYQRLRDIVAATAATIAHLAGYRP